jgi:uncharacterized protein
MRCFFFGNAGRQLYGALHPATSAAARSTAVVLAYPWLSEYNRCHPAFRKLATLLSRAGFPTLRFDYSGTGDSEDAPHALEESFCRTWSEDIATACRELSALSHARSICVVGLGVGATLAIRAASLEVVDQLVLWEPVVSGQRYLAELDQLDRRLRLARLYPPAAAQRDELLGYGFSQAARDELAQLDVRHTTLPAATSVSVVAPESWPELRALTAHFPRAQLELFTRASAALDPAAEHALLAMEPLHAVVRSVERAESA